jgi:diguanylate cyclase (GGDEF)-like protein/PAS domain S-box-containing protein
MRYFPTPREWSSILLITAGQLLLVVWALRLVAPEEAISLLWLPDGYLLGFLVLLPMRLWPAQLASVALSVLALEMITTDRALTMILGFTFANLIESAGGAWLFLRVAGGREAFRSFADLGYFLACCVLLLPAVSASIGAASVVAHTPAADFLSVYRTWHSSAGLGILFLAPLIVISARWFREGQLWQRLGDRSLWLTLGSMLTVVAAASAVNVHSADLGLVMVFLSLPILIWAAMRFGLLGGIAAVAVLVVSSVQLTAMGIGPFSGQGATAAEAVFRLQSYLGAALVATVFTSLAVDRLRQTTEALAETSSRFRALFDHSPAALWEEDFSEVKRYLDDLRARGIADVATWLREHPEAVSDCARRVKVIAVNDRTLSMFGAGDVSELLSGLEGIFGEEALNVFREEIIALDRGAREFRAEAPQKTLGGETIHTITGVALVPGAEQDWRRVLVSIEDISGRRRAERALADSEAMLSELIGNLDAGVVVHLPDTRVLLCNPRANEILGFSGDEMIGRSAFAESWCFLDSSGAKLPTARFPVNRIVETGAPLKNALIGIQRPGEDGPAWVLVNGTTLRDEAGALSKIIISFVDITDLHRAEERLRQAATVFANTSEGVAITGLDGRILDVNAAFSRITGYTHDEVVGRNPSILQSGRHDRAFYAAMWQSLKETGNWRGEVWNRRKNGNVYPQLLTISGVYDEHREVSGYVGVFTDISALKRSEEKLEHLAHHDPLTDLPNRLLFNARLQQSIRHARRRGKALAVAILDLDYFKHVNDSLGPATGDELLKRAAARLSDCIGNDDTVARTSGDEFAVLLEEIDSIDHAAVLTRTMSEALGRPFKLAGEEVRITVSAGLSVYPDDAEDASTLLRNANMAMHRAKEEGRNTYQFYTAELTSAAFEHLFLENALRGAAEKHELRLLYQPQVDLNTGELVGFEALLRWHHPEQGLISPVRFIPIAEQSGLIWEIGAWVLRTACRQGRAWLDEGLGFGRIAVNVAGPQLAQGTFEALVLDELASAGLPASHLALEVTESFVMHKARAGIQQLANLHDAGIQIAIDDFGTGYSSLTYLKHLPIDKLKIDQSFVRDIPRSQDDMAIVEAIISMGQALDLSVIAEGVETAEQANFLVDHGCIQAQGFLFSKPLSLDRIDEHLIEHLRQTPREHRF